MKNNKIKSISIATMALLLSISAAGCSTAQDDGAKTANVQNTAIVTSSETTAAKAEDVTPTEASEESAGSAAEASLLVPSELFSNRDLEQTADLSSATEIQLESNKDVTLSDEGVYVLSGEAENMTIFVEASDDAKVQIVLAGVTITNEDAPAIYVKSADKVFVTSTDSSNFMEVTGSYAADGDTHLDAVIFSRSDIVLNGTGSLDIVSNEGNGVSSKDDLKITGGVYTIQASADGLEANDAILIYDGALTITSGNDALQSKNDDDSSLGNIYMLNGTLNISAGDDAIRGNNMVQIDGGIIQIETSVEGIEATHVQINGGQITLYATDDGINASKKVDSDVIIEVNGGTINVSMAGGDTDAFDSNGDIYINGGTITVEASSAFDSDGTAKLNGGNVTVNGEKITEITQSQMGGGGGRRR
ncbi:carbohydrate-binding domain-containing protein [Paenibacillus sp. HB172176]|uniref:carbohydrate-binding domain-containing protein n=1 Tax=Paenibacillus sp. HB172176 TaxID=2493690 RepID=UPI00143BB713|nr:carbohydrate-binding domain-containing protein [Paenibacillus sp. HB172176]